MAKPSISPSPSEATVEDLRAEVVRLREIVAQQAGAREDDERWHAASALRASEEKYRTLFESIDEGFCIIEVLFDDHGHACDYRFVEANPAFEQQTGFTNAIGRTMRELAPAHETHWYEVYGRVATSGQSVRFENAAAALGRYYDVYAFRVGVPGQRLVAVLFHDISERTRREKHTALLDQVGKDLAQLTTPEEIMQKVGSRLGEHLGLSGCVFAEVDEDASEVTVHYGWTTGDVPSLRQTFHLKDFLTDEFQRANRAGNLFVVTNTAQDPRTDAKKYAQLKVGAFITIPFHRFGRWTQSFAVTNVEPRVWRKDEIELFRDLSERLFARIERARADEDLTHRARSDAFRVALNDSLRPLSDPVMIEWEASRLLGKHLRTQRVAYAEMDGDSIVIRRDYTNTVSSMVGRYPREAFGRLDTVPLSESSTYVLCDVQADLGLSPEEKTAHRAKDIGALVAVTLIRKGKLAAVFAAHHVRPRQWTREEITLTEEVAERIWSTVERARAEEALRVAKEEAESANRAKDDLLAALSHELRNPLNPVLLCASDLALDASLPAGVREQMRMIHRNIELEARLIDDLLDLTRITHGKMGLQLAIADAHALLRHTEEIVRVDAIAAGVDLQFNLEAENPQVQADAARLQQVFWNLVKNAIKFSCNHDLNEVRVRTFNPSPGHLTVEVQDHGIGITAAAMANIFRPFEQGDQGGDHRFGGLGLGLAISKAIIDLHQGELLASSAGPGCGSTFTVKLATTVGPVSRGAPSGAAGGTIRPLRLLVVEDDQTTLQALTRLLQRDGHSVHAARTAQEALRFAADHDCDLVISDIGLPDQSGVELMRELRARRRWRGIALSGYGMDDDIQASLTAGFHAHLVKPLEMETVRRAIREAIMAENAASGAPT